MEEISKEELERITDVFSKYKDGFESGTIIVKSVLLTVGEPNKNEDIFEMPKPAEIHVFQDDESRCTKSFPGPSLKCGEAVLDSRRVVIGNLYNFTFPSGEDNYKESVTYYGESKVWRKSSDGK